MSNNADVGTCAPFSVDKTKNNKQQKINDE